MVLHAMILAGWVLREVAVPRALDFRLLGLNGLEVVHAKMLALRVLKGAVVWACNDAEEDEAAFRVFRARAPPLLANLRPDNYPSFAAMFVGSVLQAAATSEAFPDDELSQLANRDLSKFARLQERIKVGRCTAACLSSFSSFSLPPSVLTSLSFCFPPSLRHALLR